MNFVKASLGTGILAMPDAIKNAGLVVFSIHFSLQLFQLIKTGWS